MHRSTSLYLDLLRAIAAFIVVLSHAQLLAMPSIPRVIAHSGADAVAIFFVLSGLVIRYVTQDRNERDWRTYGAARVARIMPVAAAALIVTFIADRIGLALNPNLYLSSDRFNQTIDTLTTVRAITFTNEIWFTHSIFGSNEPYWSLGFEVQYYIGFALLIFLPLSLRAVFLVLWAALVGPKILMFAPLWLLGTWVYQIIRKKRPARKALGIVLFMLGMITYAVLRWGPLHMPFVEMYNAPSLKLLVVAGLEYTTVGLATAASIIGVDLMTGEKNLVSDKVGSAVRWLASGSFSLYAFHLPILLSIEAFWPTVRKPAQDGALVVLITCALCYSLSYLVERPKQQFKAMAKRLFKAT